MPTISDAYLSRFVVGPVRRAIVRGMASMRHHSLAWMDSVLNSAPTRRLLVLSYDYVFQWVLLCLGALGCALHYGVLYVMELCWLLMPKTALQRERQALAQDGFMYFKKVIQSQINTRPWGHTGEEVETCDVNAAKACFDYLKKTPSMIPELMAELSRDIAPFQSCFPQRPKMTLWLLAVARGYPQTLRRWFLGDGFGVTLNEALSCTKFSSDHHNQALSIIDAALRVHESTDALFTALYDHFSGEAIAFYPRKRDQLQCMLDELMHAQFKALRPTPSGQDEAKMIVNRLMWTDYPAFHAFRCVSCNPLRDLDQALRHSVTEPCAESTRPGSALTRLNHPNKACDPSMEAGLIGCRLTG